MSGENKVRLQDQERLDAPDARAFQGLTYQYIRQALGDLWGGGVGALSPVVWTMLEGGTSLEGSMAPFAFLTKEIDLTRTQLSIPLETVTQAWQAIIYSFDPTLADHINYPVDFTAARAAAASSGYTTRPLVWCRPIDVDGDNDTRRIWDIGSQLEVATGINTRTKQRLEFAVSETQPAAGSGATWNPVARCYGWEDPGTGYQPQLHTVSAWDSPDLYNWTEGGADFEAYDQDVNPLSVGLILDRLTKETASGDTTRGLSGWPAGTDRGMGLVGQLHFLRRAIQRILAGGYADSGAINAKDWLGIPQYSLEGLRINQDDLVARVTSAENNIQLNANVNQRLHPVASGVFVYDNGLGYGGVSEGWYLLTGFGFTGNFVKTGAHWGEFTAQFELPASVAQALKYYCVSSVQTTLDNPDAFSGPSDPSIYCAGLELNSPLRPDPYSVSPTAYVKGNLVDHYTGSQVGLSAGEYGVPFRLNGSISGSGITTPQLALIDPLNLSTGLQNARPAFHVTVFVTAP